jgi:non-specific serine/threonine protein kinase
VEANTLLIREGDADQRFGIIIEGRVEMSVDGHRVCELAYGEVFGELAFLDQQEHRHTSTAVATTSTVFLEINPSALSWPPTSVRRLFAAGLSPWWRAAWGRPIALSKDGPPAERITVSGFGMELQLLTIEH